MLKKIVKVFVKPMKIINSLKKQAPITPHCECSSTVALSIYLHDDIGSTIQHSSRRSNALGIIYNNELGHGICKRGAPAGGSN